jgi:hypothetical protein
MKSAWWLLLGLRILAEPPATQAQLTYMTNDGAITITGYSGGGAVTIPSNIDGLMVTSIAAEAFSGSSLTSVYFEGHAPAADSSVFVSDDNVTAYYLPGATGWGEFSANTGLPALLWNPVIQTNGGSFGLSNNQFGFNILGTSNIPIVVEVCLDLANADWTSLASLTLTNGLFAFNDPQWTNYPTRFYRIRSR